MQAGQAGGKKRQPPMAASFAGPALLAPIEDYLDNFLESARQSR
jgi:hypothetical protein